MHPKSDNIKLMTNSKTDHIINKPFSSIISRIQADLETSIRDSNFVFDSVDELYHKFHNKSLKCNRSCRDSSDYIINKKKQQ